jgi:hypothetical protein
MPQRERPLVSLLVLFVLVAKVQVVVVALVFVLIRVAFSLGTADGLGPFVVFWMAGSASVQRERSDAAARRV